MDAKQKHELILLLYYTLLCNPPTIFLGDFPGYGCSVSIRLFLKLKPYFRRRLTVLLLPFFVAYYFLNIKMH